MLFFAKDRATLNADLADGYSALEGELKCLSGRNCCVRQRAICLCRQSDGYAAGEGLFAGEVAGVLGRSTSMTWKR
jgi:hypothetical protein